MLILSIIESLEAKSAQNSAHAWSKYPSLGYVTDMQRGYDDSGDKEMESEGEGFTYYMTRQAKNATKVKYKTGIKMKQKLVRKPSGT